MRALLFLMLVGCVDLPDESAPIAPAVEVCGDVPLAPAFVAAFDGDRVTMHRSTYLEIAQWREDLAAWRTCAEQP